MNRKWIKKALKILLLLVLLVGVTLITTYLAIQVIEYFAKETFNLDDDFMFFMLIEFISADFWIKTLFLQRLKKVIEE